SRDRTLGIRFVTLLDCGLMKTPLAQGEGMFKVLVVVSAVGLGALAVKVARAEEFTLQPTTQPESAPAPQTSAEQPPPPPKGLLDDALSKWSVTKPLEDNGWSFGGWIE